MAIASASAAGEFGCTAVGAVVDGSAISTANAPNLPCATAFSGPINDTVPVASNINLTLDGVYGGTKANNPLTPGYGHGGGAYAGVVGAYVTVGSLNIQVGTVQSLIASICPAGDTGLGTPGPEFLDDYPSDHTIGLNINGGPTLNFTQPTTIKLGTATLYLNRAISTGTSLQFRSFELDSPLLPGGSIIIGDSLVDYTGTPCTSAGT